MVSTLLSNRSLLRHQQRLLAATWGYRTFRAISGGLILKANIDQWLPEPTMVRKPPNCRALPQAALRATTAIIYTESTITAIAARVIF